MSSAGRASCRSEEARHERHQRRRLSTAKRGPHACNTTTGATVTQLQEPRPRSVTHLPGPTRKASTGPAQPISSPLVEQTPRDAESRCMRTGSDLHFRWWRGKDLNLRPSGYEPSERALLYSPLLPRRTADVAIRAMPVTSRPVYSRALPIHTAEFTAPLAMHNDAPPCVTRVAVTTRCMLTYRSGVSPIGCTLGMLDRHAQRAFWDAFAGARLSRIRQCGPDRVSASLPFAEVGPFVATSRTATGCSASHSRARIRRLVGTTLARVGDPAFPAGQGRSCGLVIRTLEAATVVAQGWRPSLHVDRWRYEPRGLRGLVCGAMRYSANRRRPTIRPPARSSSGRRDRSIRYGLTTCSEWRSSGPGLSSSRATWCVTCFRSPSCVRSNSRSTTSTRRG